MKRCFGLGVRLLCVLFLFVFLGGGIFVAGLVYTRIPEGFIGVMYTPTTGYTLVPQDLMWTWKKLIPAHFQLYSYPDTPRNLSFQSTGFLPHIPSVNNATVAQDHFPYTLNGHLFYKLTAEGLLNLLNTHAVEAKNVSLYYETLDKEIEQKLQFVLTNTPDVWLHDQGPLQGIVVELNKIYPQVQFVRIVWEEQELPDLVLYRQSLDIFRREYQQLLEIQKLQQQKQIQLTLQQEQKLKLLERYGEILTKYPILISFFAVDQGKLLPRDVLPDFLPPAATTAPRPDTPPSKAATQ